MSAYLTSADGATVKEMIAAARCYLEAASIAAWADHTNGSVRRYMERHGVDPESDEDYRLMVSNTPRHYWGWDKAPKEWPWDAALWQPCPDAEGNLTIVAALTAAALNEPSPHPEVTP